MKKNLYILLIALFLCAVFVSCTSSQTNMSAEPQDSNVPVTTTASSDTVTTAPETEMLEVQQPHIELPPKFNTHSYDEYLAYIQTCKVPLYATFEQISALGTFEYMVDSYEREMPAGMYVGYTLRDTTGHRLLVKIGSVELEDTAITREILFRVDTDNMRKLDTTFSSVAEYTKDGITYIYAKDGSLMRIEWEYNGWNYSISNELSTYPENADTVLAQLLDAKTATAAMASLMAPKS